MLANSFFIIFEIGISYYYLFFYFDEFYVFKKNTVISNITSNFINLMKIFYLKKN